MDSIRLCGARTELRRRSQRKTVSQYKYHGGVDSEQQHVLCMRVYGLAIYNSSYPSASTASYKANPTAAMTMMTTTQ